MVVKINASSWIIKGYFDKLLLVSDSEITDLCGGVKNV